MVEFLEPSPDFATFSHYLCSIEKKSRTFSGIHLKMIFGNEVKKMNKPDSSIQVELRVDFLEENKNSPVHTIESSKDKARMTRSRMWFSTQSQITSIVSNNELSKFLFIEKILLTQ